MRQIGPAHAPPSRPRDPAPSRLGYRLQRMWLTRSVRRLILLGPPLALAAGVLFHFGTDPETRTKAEALFAAARHSVENREELIVDAIRVTGAPEPLRATVLEVADIPVPVSSLKIDVAGLRRKIAAIPAVRSASVRISKGGIIHIDLVERMPAAVWRLDGALHVVDHDGTVLLRDVARIDHPDLPLVLGDQANLGVTEALALLGDAGPLADRVRGLHRVGARRWNVMLDRDQVIMLPEHAPDHALQRIVGLDAVDDLLERDVSIVDFRDGTRPILRLGDFALSEIHRLQAMERGEEE